MAFAANFTAIDFETASHRSDSACQLAAVIVRDGKIADSAMWMIRPVPLNFSPSNIRIHGITPDRVRDEATFGDLWSEISDTLADDCLVAHNASFDIGVLLACLRKHRKDVPDIQFTCTRAIARATWPSRGRFGLKPLSDWLGIRFQHHDALEDSVACAKVLLAAGMAKEAVSLPDLEKKLRLSRGTAGRWGKRGPSGGSNRTRRRWASSTTYADEASREARRRVFGAQGHVTEDPNSYEVASSEQPGDERETSIDLQRLLIRADFTRPLSGESIVFTGRLSRLSRDDAENLAERCGGTCQGSVTRQTSIVVLGSTDPETQSTGESKSVKHRAAEQLQRAGKPIRIVTEDEFLGMVGGSCSLYAERNWPE